MTLVATALGLTKLDEYLPTLLMSSGFFLVIQLITHAFGARPNVAGRIVSMIHALVILPLAYSAMQAEKLNADPAFGWDPRAGLTFAVCCGFLWDIMHTTVWFGGMGFVAHAVACFSVYMFGFTPFLAYFGARCLMFEASTPFLNIHWYLLKTGRSGGKLAMINGVLLLTTFFFCRLVYGTYVSYGFFKTIFERWDE
ncbi:hypothetical protein EXIGLDRAFT_771112, partial [Exidia glandulosa HHB12029]